MGGGDGGGNCNAVKERGCDRAKGDATERGGGKGRGGKEEKQMPNGPCSLFLAAQASAGDRLALQRLRQDAAAGRHNPPRPTASSLQSARLQSLPGALAGWLPQESKWRPRSPSLRPPPQALSQAPVQGGSCGALSLKRAGACFGIIVLWLAG